MILMKPSYWTTDVVICCHPLKCHRWNTKKHKGNQTMTYTYSAIANTVEHKWQSATDILVIEPIPIYSVGWVYS